MSVKRAGRALAAEAAITERPLDERDGALET